MQVRRKPTGSKVHRLWQCPASFILPQNTNEDHEARTEPMRGKGQVVHKYLERVRAGGVDAALSQVPADHVMLCKALDIDRLPTHLSCEVAFAWNWKTLSARELGRGPDLPRHPDGAVNYDELGVDWSCEIPVTVDVTGMAEWSPKGSMETLRRGYVGDYKTGHTRYPRPSRNGQILIGAVCIRYLMQLDDVTGELLYIDDDGDCYPQRDLIDSWTLDSFERELAAIMEEQPALQALYEANGGGVLAKHEGPHCDHCAAYKDCSAKTGLVKAMPEALIKIGARRDTKGDFELIWVPEIDKKTGKPKGDDKGSWELQLAPGAVTVRNAAAMYEAAERIQALCSKIKDEVCSLGYHEPIPLSDGRVIERYTTKRRATDGRVAAGFFEQWLAAKMTPDEARKKVMAKLDVKLSLEACRDLVTENIDWNTKPRPVIESKNGTGVLDKLLVELERAGGLHVNSSEECKPHKVRAAKKNGS